MKNKYWLIGVVGLIIGAIVFFGFNSRGKDLVAGVVSTFTTSTDSYLNQTSDIVGSHIGTSTLGASFPTIDSTSTYVVKIGRNTKQATFQIKVVAVTTTANHLDLAIQGSNDYLCDTSAGSASSTTDVIKDDINWYDAMTNLSNRVHPTSFTGGSKTAVLNWPNAVAGDTNQITLTNLNFECLRLSVSASSTKPYIGISTK